MSKRVIPNTEKKMIPFPDRKYNIIYADPPWSYNDKNCNGSVQDYDTLEIEDIKNLPVSEITHDNAVLFLWATYPLLKEALEVMESWGFSYKGIAFQWVKLNRKNGEPFYGLGRWTRGNTEPCLLATKGKPKRQSSDVFQLIRAPIQGHSAKPNVVREKIVKLMGPLPRIELFSRDIVDGWDAWGDEIPNGYHLTNDFEVCDNKLLYTTKEKSKASLVDRLF